MNKGFENEILSSLEEMFKESGLDVYTDDIAGIKTVVVEYEEDEEPDDLNVSIQEFGGEKCVYVLSFVRSGFDEEVAEGLIKLLPYLNKFLTIGAFCIKAGEDGTFDFTYEYTYVLDKNAEFHVLLRVLFKTLEIIMGTEEEAIYLLAPYLKGEASAESLMNDELSIAQ